MTLVSPLRVLFTSQRSLAMFTFSDYNVNTTMYSNGDTFLPVERIVSIQCEAENGIAKTEVESKALKKWNEIDNRNTLDSLTKERI